MNHLKTFESFLNPYTNGNYTPEEQDEISKIILSKDNSFSPYDAKERSKSYSWLKDDHGDNLESAADEIIKYRKEEREEHLNNPTLKKVVDGINSGKLKILRGGEKMYGKLKLSITELIWARNFEDGFDIDVYEDGSHIGTVELTKSTNWKPKIKEE